MNNVLEGSRSKLWKVMFLGCWYYTKIPTYVHDTNKKKKRRTKT